MQGARQRLGTPGRPLASLSLGSAGSTVGSQDSPWHRFPGTVPITPWGPRLAFGIPFPGQHGWHLGIPDWPLASLSQDSAQCTLGSQASHVRKGTRRGASAFSSAAAQGSSLSCEVSVHGCCLRCRGSREEASAGPEAIKWRSVSHFSTSKEMVPNASHARLGN